MSARYLLPCSCGKSVAVGASQAGGSVTCECGARLDVPRLRDLQALPTEAPTDDKAAGWSFRLGFLSAGLTVAVVLAAIAAWFALQTPAPPEPFDAAARQTNVERGLEQAPPAELYRMLVGYYEPLVERGLEVERSPRDLATIDTIERYQWRRDALLIAAGVVMVLSLTAYALLPKN